MPPAHHVGVELVISGWAHTPFGKHQATLEDLISIVVRDAIAHAGLEPKDIDEIVLGNFNAGMNALAFPSSLALQAHPDLGGLPATRVENACASGSAPRPCRSNWGSRSA